MTTYSLLMVRDARKSALLTMREVVSDKCSRLVHSRAACARNDDFNLCRLASLPETHHPLRGRRHQADEIHARAFDVRRRRHPAWAQPEQDQGAHGGPFEAD